MVENHPSKKTCSIRDCSRVRYCRDMCSMHYKRWQKTEHPEQRYYYRVDAQATARERFWANVPTGLSQHDCWEWQGYRNKNGYGEFHVERRLQLAHRYSYFLQTGEWGEYLLHSCDNPACVNPAHLSVGTHQQNMAEAAQRGLMCHGEDHPYAKLTKEAVHAIRERHRQGESQLSLAKVYGVHQTTIRNVVKHITWKETTTEATDARFKSR